jgi:hypothetical protein
MDGEGLRVKNATKFGSLGEKSYFGLKLEKKIGLT